MISALPTSTYFGVSNPLQSQVSQDRVSIQIQTDDFERVHTRGVENSSGGRGSSGVKNTTDEEKIRASSRGAAFVRRPTDPTFKKVVLEGDGKIRNQKAATAMRRSDLLPQKNTTSVQHGASYVKAAYQARAHETSQATDTQSVDVHA